MTGCFSISLDNNVVFNAVSYDDGSILSFINDDAWWYTDVDRYFGARFCGNGNCIYSPFDKVVPVIYDEESVIICDDDVSHSLDKFCLGNRTASDDTDETIVGIWRQLIERPQGLNKWRRSFWVK